MQRDGVVYSLLFAAAVCIACAVVVSASAVGLKERQALNAELDRKKNVLQAAGFMEPGEALAAAEVEARFAVIDAVAVDLLTGEEDPAVDAATYDARKALSDPAMSRSAPSNPAQVKRLANHAVVYQVRDEQGELEMLILPVEGKGLWSTMYGFLALDSEFKTVLGITFYAHGETPGLGGEVDNPRWKALWKGRLAFDEDGQPALEVVRGRAGPAEEDPYRVDGLSGATLTSRGVTYLVQFWLGEHGFGPYLKKLKTGAA